MEKVIIYSVDLMDLATFTFFHGAEDFRRKYSQNEYQHSYFIFSFDNDNWLQAENELEQIKLNYRKFFEIKLTDEEIIYYPVFNLTIPAMYNLVKSEPPGLIDSSQMRGTAIAQDFDSGIIVIDNRIAQVLLKLNARIRFKSDGITIGKGKKKYHVISDVPVLKAPRIIHNATSAKENEGEDKGTFYADGWDGRSSLSADAIEFINNQHFVASWNFMCQGIQYRQNSPNYLVSGMFASAITKFFKKSILLKPITLNNI